MTSFYLPKVYSAILFPLSEYWYSLLIFPGMPASRQFFGFSAAGSQNSFPAVGSRWSLAWYPCLPRFSLRMIAEGKTYLYQLLFFQYCAMYANDFLVSKPINFTTRVMGFILTKPKIAVSQEGNFWNFLSKALDSCFPCDIFPLRTRYGCKN